MPDLNQAHGLPEFHDAAAADTAAALMRAATGQPYRACHGANGGYAVAAQEHARPQGEAALEYLPCLRGFIPHYALAAIGSYLLANPAGFAQHVSLAAGLGQPGVDPGVFVGIIRGMGLMAFCAGMAFIYYRFANRLTLGAEFACSRRGVIASDEVQIRYRDIKTVSVHQGLFGKLLGYGELHLDSAGTGSHGDVDIVFKRLRSPGTVRALVQRRITAALSPRGGHGA